MNAFSFIKDAQICDTPLCGVLTRIRIEERPCCELHMEGRMREGARYRLLEVTRAGRDRRRGQRREERRIK